jgi:MFS family permease
MVVLDVAIVNVALPSVQADLGLGQDDLQWVAITYGLMLGGLLLLGDRAGDLLGRRRVLVVGLAVFTSASLTAGLAGTVDAALTEGFPAGSLVAAGFNMVIVAAALWVLRPAERAAIRTAIQPTRRVATWSTDMDMHHQPGGHR